MVFPHFCPIQFVGQCFSFVLPVFYLSVVSGSLVESCTETRPRNPFGIASPEASHVRCLLSPYLSCGSYDNWIQMIFGFLTKSAPVRKSIKAYSDSLDITAFANVQRISIDHLFDRCCDILKKNSISKF